MTFRMAFVSITVGMLLPIVVTPEALAIDKGTAIVPARPAKMSPANLSEAECTGLGGKVVPVTDCKGFDACITTNKDGVVHKACLSKK